MFQLPQCDATRRAAALAGIEHSPLLQEPIAAAIAHSGSGEVRDGAWLVYDLGGGTFDVSLVRCRDGRLQVLDHDGDNHLGGRDFDRVIARRATDQIREAGTHGEFRRTDAAHAHAFAQLKVESERVRLALSGVTHDRFSVPGLVEFELDRDGLEELLAPLIRRTTALCNKLLERNRVPAADLNGLVLVGGPTLTPCVPRLIHEEVGIDARHTVDPMTIVARGAALFASTQKLPPSLRRRGGAMELQLEYEAMTTDPMPLLVGRVPEGAPAGLRVALRRADGGFTAPPAPVNAKGAFAVDLKLQPSSLNVFAIAVTDASGNPVACDPAEVKILHGFSIAKPPLSQSVGIMLADNSVTWYLRKGAVLPARQTVTHSTTVPLKKGQTGEAIHVPLVQGESSRADRNKVIGVLHIHADHIARDLPAGSEVEVTLEVDESAQTVGKAYVPLLDQWFDKIVLFDLETKEAGDVGKALESQKDRLAKLSALADDLEHTPENSDERIDEVEALLEEGDRDSIDLADQMVRMMSQELDLSEADSKKVRIEKLFAELMDDARDLVERSGDTGEKRQLKALIDEYGKAMARGDLDHAESRCVEIRGLNTRVMMRQPGFWIGYFNYLKNEAIKLGLIAVTRKAIERGEYAAQRQNMDELIDVCREILRMFPEDQREKAAGPVRSHVK
jgi:molecular chaperone DnaK